MSESRIKFKAAPDRLATVVLCLAICWFCQDLIFTRQVPFFRDLGLYFYPLRFSLFESLRSGELPLWNRHMAMGFPLLAAFQPGAFYPPHVIFLILPFFPALRAIFVVHFLIAAIGAFKLCRSWSYSYYLSIAGALLFTLGGTVVSLSNLANHFQAAVWLPFAVLTAERLARSPSWKNFLWFTAILTLQLLAGSPEIFIVSTLLVLLAALGLNSSLRGLSTKKVLIVFAAAGILVAGLAMAQLLPTLELFFESRRQQPIPAQEALQWSLHPSLLLNLFFLDKEIDLTTALGLRFFFRREAPFFISYYLGAISFFGIVLWLRFSEIREKIIVLSLVAASLVVAMGIHTPLYPFLYRNLTILGALRFPEKFFFFTYVLLLYVTLRGLHALFSEKQGSLGKWLVVLAPTAVAWLGIYFVFRSDLEGAGRFIAQHLGGVSPDYAQSKMIAGVLLNLERQLALYAGLLLLLVLSKTKKMRPALSEFLMVAIVFVDLSSAHRGLLFPLAPEFVTTKDRVIEFPESEPKRLFYYPSPQNLHPSSLTAQGQPSFKEATALAFQNLLPNAGVLFGFDYMQEIDALARRPYVDFLRFANQLDPRSQIQLLRSFNVAYLISFSPLSTEGITLVKHFPEYLSWLYRIDGPVPRAYVVGKSAAEKNSAQILRRLSNVGFDPAKEVILDEPIAISPTRPLAATAKIVRYQHTAVTIQTSANDRGVLVLADSYYPGWKAYVNGREEKILRANLFFRAVPISAGHHTVEFRYEPRSFTIGLAISLTTLVSLVLISVFLNIRKRLGRQIIEAA